MFCSIILSASTFPFYLIYMYIYIRILWGYLVIYSYRHTHTHTSSEIIMDFHWLFCVYTFIVAVFILFSVDRIFTNKHVRCFPRSAETAVGSFGGFLGDAYRVGSRLCYVCLVLAVYDSAGQMSVQ